MDEAKIRLSQAEMELVMNAEWILTKNQILDKVKRMLCELAELQKEMLYKLKKGSLPEEVQLSSFKISRGENYLGLPWVILDHPRYFTKDDVLAVRTLFWWGRCFSITLHLTGNYKLQFEKNILGRYDQLTNKIDQDKTSLPYNDYYICTNTAQWEHHFEDNNYRLVREIDTKEWQKIITGKPFIKLAKMIPLEQWKNTSNLNEMLAGHYYSMVKLLEPAD